MKASKPMSLGVQPRGFGIYFIKNRDNIVGTFRWSDDDVAELTENNGVPAHIAGDLNGWLESRTPPKHRAYMERLLDVCGLKTLKSIIDFSKGLSLNDCLWVTNNEEHSWSNVNLFANEFSDVIARIAFDGGVHGVPFSTTSPEFGTDGMLPKCWVRKGNEILLYKGGTSGACNAGYEPLSEVLAHQVLERLGYSHVPYYLENFHGRRVSVCPLFTGEDRAYLPIYRVIQFSTLRGLLVGAKEHGFETQLAQQLVFDYLSFNTDRHAGNFGCLVDPNSFEVLSMAPIFDNGMSMMCLWNGDDDMDEYCLDKHKRPALYDSYEEGAQRGKRILGRSHNVERLIDFEFDLTKIGDYSIDRVLAIQSWFQRRVRTFLEM